MNDSGQGFTEYVLIISAMAIMILGVFTYLSPSIRDFMSRAATGGQSKGTAAISSSIY